MVHIIVMFISFVLHSLFIPFSYSYSFSFPNIPIYQSLLATFGPPPRLSETVPGPPLSRPLPQRWSPTTSPLPWLPSCFRFRFVPFPLPPEPPLATGVWGPARPRFTPRPPPLTVDNTRTGTCRTSVAWSRSTTNIYLFFGHVPQILFFVVSKLVMFTKMWSYLFGNLRRFRVMHRFAPPIRYR